MGRVLTRLHYIYRAAPCWQVVAACSVADPCHGLPTRVVPQHSLHSDQQSDTKELQLAIEAQREAALSVDEGNVSKSCTRDLRSQLHESP